MKNKAKKITHKGIMRLGAISLPCFVTEDGIRLISSGAFEGFVESGSDRQLGAAAKKPPKIGVFLGSKTLKPFVEEALGHLPNDIDLSPIRAQVFTSKNASIISGYNSDAIITYCKAMINAKQADALVSNKQRFIAKQCELIRDALAWGVGLTALIDEATGYQYDRVHDALATLFDHYLAKTLQPWAKMFPDEFWEELSRLTGYYYNKENGGRHPTMGKIVRDFIYRSFPEGEKFTNELEQRNPIRRYNDTGIGIRNSRHHQWLTSDIGKLALKERINLCVNIMKGHYYWKSFTRHWWKLMSPKEFKLIG